MGLKTPIIPAAERFFTALTTSGLRDAEIAKEKKKRSYSPR
jgi:hypothetical protein